MADAVLSILTMNAQVIIGTAVDFPMENVLKRYQKETGLSPDVVHEHERELKRFLAIAAIYPEESIGMKGLIDELWHTFIIFTKDYENFCHQVAGRFIHHVPLVSEEDGRQGSSGYKRMMELYRFHFGEPAAVWPTVAFSEDGKCNVDCSDDCSNCSNNSCTS